MTPIRVGIVGVRRARQGLGPFVARELRAAGAEVVGFAGTSLASVAEAARALGDLGLPDANGYVGLDALLAQETLDALAILSPIETHAACLEAALAAGLHVLCEKPFVWDVAQPAAVAKRLVDGFAARGLLLYENCQWPYALSAFEALHPGGLAAGRPPHRFGMRLSPSATGARMLVDMLSHPLSLLQALTGAAGGRIEDVRFSTRNPAAETLRVGFLHAVEGHEVEVELVLVGNSAAPREAWLEIDGLRARRSVRASDYAHFLEDGGREVPLPDPLAALVRDFVAAVAGLAPAAPAPRADAVAWRMERVAEIVGAFEAGSAGSCCAW